MRFLKIKKGIILAASYFSPAEARLSSVLKCLTAEFGMGSGVATSLKPPKYCLLFPAERDQNALITGAKNIPKTTVNRMTEKNIRMNFKLFLYRFITNIIPYVRY